MYIEPNTTINFIRNVPLTPDYENTILFENKEAQYSYFSSMKKISVDKYTYQRVKRGYIRVGLPAGTLYDCNYLSFQNISFNEKVFYAFITGCEYVNNETCEISFELDVMQTYMFDYSLLECFVKREHSLTDNPGDNIVREDLELGEYVLEECYKYPTNDGVKSASIVFAATFDGNMEPTQGKMYNNVYSGLTYVMYDTAEEANSFIEAATNSNKIDGIVSVFMCYQDDFPNPDLGIPGINQIEITKKLSDLNGYTPKNKKLLTYPYNFLYCTTLNGNTAEFKYEFFKDVGNCQFVTAGEANVNPAITLIPVDYKLKVHNESEEHAYNYNESMVLNGFPQCTFNTDLFKAWAAQNAASTAVSVLGTAGTVIGGLAVAGATGGLGAAALAGTLGTKAASAIGSAAIGTANGLAPLLAKMYDTSTKPPQANGTPSAQNLFGYGALRFFFYYATITAEYAKIIDDYFNCYGYSTKKVKIPNTNSRPHWNFVQTVGCQIWGQLPADAMQEICAIYDRGIRFWKNPSEVGNYTFDNSPQ